MTQIKKFEIRRKEFDFASAPVLNGITAWYEAFFIHGKSDVKHTHALDAAKEAAEMDFNSKYDHRAAFVGCSYLGSARPKAVMSRPMYVSYRPRV